MAQENDKEAKLNELLNTLIKIAQSFYTDGEHEQPFLFPNGKTLTKEKQIRLSFEVIILKVPELNVTERERRGLFDLGINRLINSKDFNMVNALAMFDVLSYFLLPYSDTLERKTNTLKHKIRISEKLSEFGTNLLESNDKDQTKILKLVICCKIAFVIMKSIKEQIEEDQKALQTNVSEKLTKTRAFLKNLALKISVVTTPNEKLNNYFRTFAINISNFISRFEPFILHLNGRNNGSTMLPRFTVKGPTTVN